MRTLHARGVRYVPTVEMQAAPQGRAPAARAAAGRTSRKAGARKPARTGARTRRG